MTDSLSGSLVVDNEPGSSGSTPVVACDAATVAYRVGRSTRTVLREVTCEVLPGARIGIIGPSGSGKTSLVHLLAGLQPPASGTVAWPALGEPPSTCPGRVTVAFQAPSLLSALDVTENVALPLVLAGVTPTDAVERATRILERLHLRTMASQLPEELSGGQAQRVALARALVTRPTLLLCDEPTGQVDHGTAEELLDLVLAGASEARTAVVVATHDPAVIERLSVEWTITDGQVRTGGPGERVVIPAGIWSRGLLRRRAGRLAAVAAGVAVSVALLASLGSFLSSAKATMTRQAIRAVAVDWQIAVSPGTDAASVLSTVRSEPGVRTALPVGFATSGGLRTTTGGVTHTTGTAKVLGLSPGYSSTFSGEVRPLSGASTLPPSASPGEALPALLAQQTASNLAARVGDMVTVDRAGLVPVTVTVAGVIDLPQIDSLFQTVGARAGTQPAAPPDNVVLVAEGAWHQAFDPMAAGRPDLVAQQIHVARLPQLPTDPAAAYAQVVGAAHHLEARLAGSGIVGDNLAATLDAARQDALYAQVLFVFLGLPGALLAAALTVTVAGAGAARRQREQSLLRLRGARAGQVLSLAAIEAAVVGIGGAGVGIATALVIGAASFGNAGFGATTAGAITWMVASAAVGLAIAAVAVLIPARRDLREATVVAGRSTTARAARRRRRPLVLRLGGDLWLLVGAAVVYAITSRKGYSLVLAPEGVPTISVSYWAFAGPAMFWAGTALLTWRIVDLVLRRGRRLITWAARPLSGPLSGLAAATASRQRSLLARSTVIAGLALVFAASTAVFNSTYKAQASVDARLTNGADVAVTNPPGTLIPPGTTTRIAATPGVHGVEPLIHRYAYIGADLQDLYGVRPATIVAATTLQDAYFTGGTATQLIGRLGARPDSILVSSETVKDYQLRLGDPLTLRLQDTRTQRLIPVVFHYAGVVKEFPTAPHDSFFVTNAAYVAQASGDASAGTFLVATTGGPHEVAQRLRAVIGPGPAITDLTTTRTAVGSSLTAIDLAGLTRVELGFGLVLAVAGGGLVLGLGLAERRRDLAVVAALGARRSQLRALVHVDTAVVTLAALGAGAIGGGVLAEILVKVLAGVFDPPPAALSVPWPYLLVVAGLAVVGTSGATRLVAARASHRLATSLRDL